MNNENSLEDAMTCLHSVLSEAEISGRNSIKTELLAEEMIVRFLQHTEKKGYLSIQVRRFLGDTAVILKMAGEKFDPYEEEIDPLQDLEDTEKLEDLEAENAIRSILLRAHGESFKYSHKNHINRVRIMVGQADQSMVYITLAALLLGLIFGILIKTVLPVPLTEGLCTYLFEPLKKMFMNALKIVIAPVVFFSLASCISQFSNLADLGKIGAKVMGVYVLTSIMAISLGVISGTIIHPAEWGVALTGNVDIASVSVDSNVNHSLLSAIVNIVPSNLLEPFLNSDTLQIMFLAILCGIALGSLEKYSEGLKNLFEGLNSLFLTITTILSRFIPVAVFCSVVLMVINTGGKSFTTVFAIALNCIVVMLLMLVVYSLLIILFARLNPFTFFSKIKEGMLTSFSLSSSSAAMPTNLRICTDNLGISPKICNFSIPLGATINMDGACITLSVVSLALARAYGVTVDSSAMTYLIITIMLLSVATPGVPGAGLVCLGILLDSINVPVEALGLVIAVLPLVEMFSTMTNVTGDMAASLIVAKSEKLLDMDKYKAKI